MRKAIIMLFTLLAVLLSACSTVQTGNVVAGQQQTVKIGVIMPLTGDLAFVGQTVKNSIEMAVSELNNTKYKYEVIYEDDALNPKLTATAAQKLTAIDHVDALVSLSSGSGNVVAPIAKDNKIIHIGIASDGTIADDKYNFLHYTSPSQEAKAWIAEAQRRGYKRIAILTVNQQGEIAIADQVKQNATGTNISVVYESIFNFGDTDFRTTLLKAQQANPDIYMLLAFSPEIDLLYKQLKEQGITATVSSIECFELSNNPGQFEGLWYVNAADSSNTFINAYTTKYGKAPAFAAGNGYDILNMLVYSYETAGTDPSVKPTNEQVSHVLQSLHDFHGALGTLSTGTDGIVKSPASVRIIKDGKPVTMEAP